jgi:hypothetical protein
LAASATNGRPQTDLAFSSNARPPKGTIAAFDFTDVGTLRRQLSKETTPFFPNPAVALFDSPMNALACIACEKIAPTPRGATVSN